MCHLAKNDVVAESACEKHGWPLLVGLSYEPPLLPALLTSSQWYVSRIIRWKLLRTFFKGQATHTLSPLFFVLSPALWNAFVRASALAATLDHEDEGRP